MTVGGDIGHQFAGERLSSQFAGWSLRSLDTTSSLTWPGTVPHDIPWGR